MDNDNGPRKEHGWKPTPREVVSHVIAVVIAAVATWPASYYIGNNNGFEKGMTEGRAAAMEAAKGIGDVAAGKAVDRVTDLFIAREVKQTCGNQFEAQQRACEKQVADEQRAALEKAQLSCQSTDVLAAYYKLFKKYVQEGAAVKNEPASVSLLAERLLSVRDAGRAALGQITGEVLNGKIDQLAEARSRKDTKLMAQLLVEIAGTLEVRDIAFRRAMDTIRSAK